MSEVSKMEYDWLREKVESLEDQLTALRDSDKTNTAALILIVKMVVQGDPKLITALSHSEREEFRKVVGL